MAFVHFGLLFLGLFYRGAPPQSSENWLVKSTPGTSPLSRQPRSSLSQPRTLPRAWLLRFEASLAAAPDRNAARRRCRPTYARGQRLVRFTCGAPGPSLHTRQLAWWAKGAEDPDRWSWGYLGSWVIRTAWARSASLPTLRAWKPEGLTRPAPVGRPTSAIALISLNRSHSTRFHAG